MNLIKSKPRLPWKKEEDQALIYLKEDLKIQKWTEISEKLATIYNIQNRNHQQCRDRYVNFLRNHLENKKWPHENFQKLIQLYLRYGNKWSEIANHFENINGLLIKNKFYSRLRKGIRNINFLIQTFLNETWDKFSFNVTFKLINCVTNKFDYPEKSPLGKKIQNQITFVEDLVKSLFRISWLDKRQLRRAYKQKKIEAFHQETINKLIQDLNFVDENLDAKHSNRLVFKQNSTILSLNRMKIGKRKKIEDFESSQKIEKDNIQTILGKQNQIAHDRKKSQIQIISVNSFEKYNQIMPFINVFSPSNKTFEKFENLDQKNQIARISMKQSGYKQHNLEEVKIQASESVQGKFLVSDKLSPVPHSKTHEQCIQTILNC